MTVTATEAQTLTDFTHRMLSRSSYHGRLDLEFAADEIEMAAYRLVPAVRTLVTKVHENVRMSEGEKKLQQAMLDDIFGFLIEIADVTRKAELV